MTSFFLSTSFARNNPPRKASVVTKHDLGNVLSQLVVSLSLYIYTHIKLITDFKRLSALR